MSIKIVKSDCVISVRQWEKSSEGVLKSGKKGLTFSVDEWVDLLSNSAVIDTAIAEDGETAEFPIEDSVYRVTVKKMKEERVVSIRDTVVRTAGTYAGKRGISLSQAEWSEITRQRDELDLSL